ncbi:apolipophorins-like [Pomacea canaliculata]|uniref:apolipophorins-like n=1 Tax=Pomacea canaliculata TaxID=400727 RepID=UPI000D7382FC|nr:apolipophorins-like [Pomacea canaliculata]
MMISGEVQGLQLHLWLSSLGMLQVVTENMLNEAKALLDLSTLAAEAALPVSSMVSTFCRRHSDCGAHNSVSRIMLALKKNIGVACEADRMSQGKIVRTLHAIGNSGQAAQVEDVLDNCIRRKYFPEVRIAALQALYYMPCTVNRTRAEGIFHDQTEDWEVRITSYLVIMQCATLELLSKLRLTIATEQNEQVLSFVKSHVTNLRKKARSGGDHVPKFLDNAEFSSWEKEEQKLQTAKNIYASFFSERHNVGIQIDANVLWPSSSPLAFDLFIAASSNTSVAWLPRSSALKIAVDAFGDKWDLFEVGLRAEGLEPVIENIILSSFPAIRSSHKKPVRGDTGGGSLYARFQGKEIAFFRSEMFTPGQSTWPAGQTLLSALRTLSTEGRYNFTQSAILADVSLVVPTASGLPLTLGLNSSASVELAVFGKLDFHDLTSSPRNLHAAGQIRAR